MANSKSSGDYYEYATIDTAPEAAGYWTNAVSIRRKGNDIRNLFFSIREGDTDSVATVKLQFKCPGDTGWTNYYNDGNDWNIGDRKWVDSNASGVQWRAGVESGGFTSGKVFIGFDW